MSYNFRVMLHRCKVGFLCFFTKKPKEGVRGLRFAKKEGMKIPLDISDEYALIIKSGFCVRQS